MPLAAETTSPLLYLAFGLNMSIEADDDGVEHRLAPVAPPMLAASPVPVPHVLLVPVLRLQHNDSRDCGDGPHGVHPPGVGVSECACRRSTQRALTAPIAPAPAPAPDGDMDMGMPIGTWPGPEWRA